MTSQVRIPFAQALLLLLMATAALVEAAEKSAKPNIVLIVSDDHGLDALGAYGNPVIRTPNLDALAADGTRFTMAFCTTASCSPSRSVLLTGQQNHRNGMYGLQHDENHFHSFETVKSLPVRLASAGYRTARVGKFHVAPETVFHFETVLSAGAANDPASLGRSPVAMAERSREVIAAPGDRPFFLYFATDDPHRANAVLPNGQPTFETYPAPNRFGNRPAGYPGIEPVVYAPETVRVPSFLPDNATTRAELAEYYQAVSRLDQGIGRLIAILKETGKYESTLIVYLSDNGAAFPGAKTTLYEPGIRLPLIVRAPGRKNPGAVQAAMVSWTDIAPTLLEVAGVRAMPEDFDGRSFCAGLDGAELSGWDEVFGSHTFHQVTMYYPMRMVRTRRYKLIHNLASGLTFPSARDLIQSPTWISAAGSDAPFLGRRRIADYLERPEFELYDLEQDPEEITNLADAAAYQSLKTKLITKLKRHQEVTKDPWRHKWDYQ